MKEGPTETQTKDETMMIDDGGLGLGLLSLEVLLSFYPCVSVASLAELQSKWMLGGRKVGSAVKEAKVGIEVLLTTKTSSPIPIALPLGL